MIGKPGVKTNIQNYVQRNRLRLFPARRKKKSAIAKIEFPNYPPALMKLLYSRRRPNRLLEVYSMLESKAGWYSAEEINKNVKYVKRTLQGILNKLVEKKLVKKTRSLSDARVTLFCAVSIEDAMAKVVS
ncbi:MAG: hypothetical protein ACTSVM_00015 [Candidatus Ranarchaeia archaeon]